MKNPLPVDPLILKLRQCRRNDTIAVIRDTLVEWLHSLRFVDQNDAMPSVSGLAARLNVARQTVQKVYLQLEHEKLIIRHDNERSWKIRPHRNSNLPNIALILPAMFSDYYLPSAEYGQRHFGVFTGMTDRAMELGYALVPRQLPPPGASGEEIRGAIDNLKRHYAGVIHVGERGYGEDPPLAELLRQKEIPQIAIDCEFDCPWIGSVTFDPDHVARVVANCLREHGHRNVGLVYSRTNPPPQTPRCTYMMISRDAVLHAFSHTPIKFDRLFEVTTEGHLFGKRFQKQLLDMIRKEDAPTAFWCRDDISAMELIRFLNSLGFSVPGDFSVIGFDDLPVSERFDPPLTTLRNPIYELGYTAMSNLNFYIIRGLEAFERITRLPPALYLRQSVSTVRVPARRGIGLPEKSEMDGQNCPPGKFPHPSKIERSIQS